VIAGDNPAFLGEERKASTTAPRENSKTVTQATGIYDGNCIVSESVDYSIRALACLQDL
jgi:hypothetical protein